MAAGEVGQGAAGFGEADVGAAADGEVPEGLRDVGFADAGPCRMTDSPACSQRRAARSRICGTTREVYTHVLPESERKAAELMEAVLGDAATWSPAA